MPPRTRRRSWPHMYVTLLRENGLPAGALLRQRGGVRRGHAKRRRACRETHVAVGLRSLAASGVRGGGVPDGVREQVVQAQRGEGGAANGEKGERVAQKGAHENEHGEAEVVHAVVVDCPSTGEGAHVSCCAAHGRMQPPAPAVLRTVALEPRRPLGPRLGRRKAREELCGRDRRLRVSAAAFGSARARAPERRRGRVRPHAPPGGRGFWFQSTCERRLRQTRRVRKLQRSAAPLARRPAAPAATRPPSPWRRRRCCGAAARG